MNVLDVYYAFQVNKEAKDEQVAPEKIAKRDNELARYRRGVKQLHRLHIGRRQATSIVKHRDGAIVYAGYIGAMQVYREIWLE